MRILFLHGYGSEPGGITPTFFGAQGYEVLNPSLSSEDFEESVRIAQQAKVSCPYSLPLLGGVD